MHFMAMEPAQAPITGVCFAVSRPLGVVVALKYLSSTVFAAPWLDVFTLGGGLHLTWSHGFELTCVARSLAQLAGPVMFWSFMDFTSDNCLAVAGADAVALFDVTARTHVGFVAPPGMLRRPCVVSGSAAGFVAVCDQADGLVRVFRRNTPSLAWEVAHVLGRAPVSGIVIKFPEADAAGGTVAVLTWDAEHMCSKITTCCLATGARIGDPVHTFHTPVMEQYQDGWLVWAAVPCSALVRIPKCGGATATTCEQAVPFPSPASFLRWCGDGLLVAKAVRSPYDGDTFELHALVALSVERVEWMAVVARAVMKRHSRVGVS
jgi:hypothetical protein